jgi:hypothetical protein
MINLRKTAPSFLHEFTKLDTYWLEEFETWYKDTFGAAPNPVTHKNRHQDYQVAKMAAAMAWGYFVEQLEQDAEEKAYDRENQGSDAESGEVVHRAGEGSAEGDGATDPVGAGEGNPGGGDLG